MEVSTIQNCMHCITTTHKVNIHITWSIGTVFFGNTKIANQTTNIQIIFARHCKRGVSRETTCHRFVYNT